MDIITYFKDESTSYTQNNNDFAVFDTVHILRTFPKTRYLNLSAFERGKYCRDAWLNLRFARDACKFQHVTAQFEVARALGSAENLFCPQSPDDIRAALHTVNEKMSSVLGTDCQLAQFGKLTRGDANRDFSLPDKAERLEIFKKMDVSRMDKEIHESAYTNGVTYAQNHFKIKLYDKYLQLENRYCHLPKYQRDWAKTLLRVESSLEKQRLAVTVKKFFRGDAPRTVAEVLTPDFAEFLVDSSLRRIEADADLITFFEWSELVKQNFKLPVAARLIEFMNDIRQRGYKTVCGKNKNNFDYHKAQLAKKGLWRTAFALSAKSALINYSNDDESFYRS